jgi:hypothetical protein
MTLPKVRFATNSHKLNEQTDTLAARVKDASDDQLDEILDDGMCLARPGYRPIQ